jgi:hypothetical protein
MAKLENKVEEKICKGWEKNFCFQWQKNKNIKKSKFI